MNTTVTGPDSPPRKAQLDKAEREHLEGVVTDLRALVENEVEYALEHQYDLTTRDGGDGLSETAQATREELVDAIEHENPGGKSWEWCYEQYVGGVGYTFINRLAALRCMEVRGFIEQPVTRIGESGLTPAAEQVLAERFDVGRNESLVVAFEDATERFDDEIELLFDTNSPYTVLDIDPDLFEEAVTTLDDVPAAVWRADDVLGWVYEYYNRPVVEALDDKNSLEAEDVGPANQFYTPHWVVRMLTDNSLGKLYLEATGQEDTIPEAEALSPEERKNRLATPDGSPDVAELCTYLIPDEETGAAPEFDHPRELRVVDPACGSGHFLLYAFDVLERIWWAETDLDRAEIPAKVLEHNLYGVDIDLRSCQLSAFNLYLKARARSEEEDGEFDMPNVDIVCADARVAQIEEADAVLDEITGEGSELRAALDDVIETFRHTEGLGSLLDVSGTLEEAFDSSETQTELSDYSGSAHRSLNSFLKALRRAVAERTSDSFGEQNLRSFLNLLVVLTQEYDTALMNPPYGAKSRMPGDVTDYVRSHYDYGPEYYINFFELCENVSKPRGRIGMIVQRSFMYKRSFREFREDFVGELGAFDFLAEYGNGVLDKATVRTAGTVVRTDTRSNGTDEGLFYRLHDVPAGRKQQGFLRAAFTDDPEPVTREYRRDLGEFSEIPGSPLSYWASPELRSLYGAETVFDAENGGVDRESLGVVKQGLATADDARFTRAFWERPDDSWKPFAKGGEDAWTLPAVPLTVLWDEDGKEIKRYSGSRPQNTQHYFSEALTYTYMKSSGRRFGYLHPSSVFGHAGNVFVPETDSWEVLAYANSHLVTYLMLCQTPERHWEVGNVSKLPWPRELSEVDDLAAEVGRIAGAILAIRRHDPTSPQYRGPALLAGLGDRWVPETYETHPHRELAETVSVPERGSERSRETELESLAVAHERDVQRFRQRMQSSAERIEQSIWDALGLGSAAREEVLSEVALRTNADPREPETYDPESVTEPPEEFPEQVEALVLHFALRAVQEADDGIVPITAVDGEDDLLTRVEAEFERVWGEHADARLAEVDDVLGSRSAAEEAYPNLRIWLEEELFDYHVRKFDRTPILWRLTTERLVSDSKGEGFGCLVDYQTLDEGVLDRLQNGYLDPRRDLLRERRNAADRRRNDESLSTSDRSEAADEYARSQNGLEQIEEFEQRLADLARSDPREWPAERSEAADAAADRVAEFRERTEDRLAIVDELASMDDVEMSELFTESFGEKIGNLRDEWLDTLVDLEAAFDAYARDGNEPVEAHLYDLFDYYTDDLLGSSHFASNGILYMTYYFDSFEKADQARLDSDGVPRRRRLLSRLASDLDEYIELGESIAEDCDSLSGAIPDDWAERALSEVTTAGYQPTHKHGVAINITPLAEQEVVPKTVDDVL